MFRPKLLDTLKNYNREQFSADLVAGIIVAIVALPLAIAFGIASGVSPEKGLYTAIIAGFIISVLGGSRVQIGGPTGAFIVIIYGIVQEYGVNGLIIATFIAGCMLVVMGLARMGNLIKFIPYSLITGFTSGIALIIFSSQVKDGLGLVMENPPADFINKWKAYMAHFSTINVYALLLTVATIIIIIAWPKVTRKIPGSLVAIILFTALARTFHFPVETIGSKFGSIPSGLPSPAIPEMNVDIIRKMFQPAFTIALLGAIESLLSAVVADGMTGGSHRSNMELVAQGTGNMFSALFGGIPATGAIARTATNIKNGGRTPVAGIVHAIALLLIMLFTAKWAAWIPMPVLAGVLIVVAYNMSEWKSFVAIAKGPRGDAAVMVITFLLTTFIDLTVAIEVGMLIAVLLFMRKMINLSRVNLLPKNNDEAGSDNMHSRYDIPPGVEVFEISGPLFFGAAYKFREALKLIESPPKVLIFRMGLVPVIDASGIKALRDMMAGAKSNGTRIILCEVNSEELMKELRDARILFAVGKANVLSSFSAAVEHSRTMLKQ